MQLAVDCKCNTQSMLGSCLNWSFWYFHLCYSIFIQAVREAASLRRLVFGIGQFLININSAFHIVSDAFLPFVFGLNCIILKLIRR